MVLPLAERGSLGVRELQPPLQLGLQDAVFGGQIFVPSQQLVSGRQFSHREIPPQRPYCMAGVRGLELANVGLKNSRTNSLVFQNIFVPETFRENCERADRPLGAGLGAATVSG